MNFRNKTILILSQADWGDMFISKHHYALELSKLGNTVYYINGPSSKKKLPENKFLIEPSGYENLFLVKHRFFFPSFLAFKIRPLFNFFVGIHIKKMIEKIRPAGDVIIWSFDLSNTMPLKFFPARNFKIFFPADEPLIHRAINAAKSANVIFSVTQEIIDKYGAYKIPKLFINHGVAGYFLNKEIGTGVNATVQIGLSGNFFRPDIDRQTLVKIIKQHPAVHFNFWGSANFKRSNAQGSFNDCLGGHNNDSSTLQFMDELSNLPNVIMHGSVKPLVLCSELQKMDAFLICYDINKDQSKGTNYHKVMEYLACGKIIISNNITTYNAYPGLFVMNAGRNNNDELPALFMQVLNNLMGYNSYQQQQQRVDFAKGYLYKKQIEKIEKFITENCE